MNELWTLKELQQRLKWNIHTLRKMAKQKVIPGMKIGKQWRFRPEDIERWIKEQEGG